MRARLTALALFSTLTLPTLAAVTGTVMNSEGQPVGGAKISLFAVETVAAQRARLLSATPQRTPIVTGQSDSKGTFKVEVPATEPTVQVQLEAKGFAPELLSAEREEDIGAIALIAAETKRGTITAGGKPVANATVIWNSGRLEATATTDAEGHYTIADPTKWANRLMVVHPDYAPLADSAGPLSSNDLKLDRVLDAGVTVKGRVVGADGSTPVIKANVLIDGWPVETTGDDGGFAVAHAPKKWETVEARSGNLAGSVSRSAKDTLVVKLAKGAMITGSVRDTKAQLPVAGAEVAVGRQAMGFGGPGNAFASAITDAKGNFSIGPLPAGSYQLSPFRPGYTIASAPAAVTAGQAMQKALLAVKDARVSGTVVDEDKRPVAAAVVAPQAVSREAGFMPRMLMMRGARTAFSGPDGRFSVRADADVDLQVSAVKKGWPAAKSSSLRLTSGERKTGVNITIPRGVAITGRVTDKNGKALSGVAVTASESEGSGGPGGFAVRRQFVMGLQRGREDDVVRTGSDGAFLIRLKEGTYDLNFKREGFAAKNVRGQQVTASAKPLEVTLNEGVEITGRVTRGGLGVEDVNISVISGDVNTFTQTGPDGTFRVGDLSPGQVMLAITKPADFIQQMRPTTAPARDVNIELPAGGTVRGHVVDKNTHQPITAFQAGITTSRQGGGMMIQTPPQLRSFTTDDGSFVLENVPPGPVEIVAQAPGYTSGRVGGLTLEEGKSLSEVEVGLDTGVRVTGRVTGPDGAPLSGATVRQDPFGGGGRRPVRLGGPDSQTVTDANGDYTIEAVEPGEKTFEFSHSGLLAEQRTVTLSGRESRIDVQLSSGTRLTGMVMTEGGVPVADASVRAMSAASGGFGGRATQTDAGGGFQFEGLAPGHYMFSASKNGYADGSARDVDISTGVPVRITLKTGGVIYGHVSGLSESELSHATVDARGSGSNASAPVDGAGNYRIEGAPTGTVRVTAEVSQGFAQNRTSPLQSVQLEPGGTMQVDLAFLNQTTIRGRVTSNGQPLTNAIVSFNPRSAKSQTNANATTDSAGNYSVTGLQDAPYTVAVVDLQRLNPYSTTYEVNGSGTFDIDIRTAAVHGRVVDAGTGEAIADARIQARKSGSDMPFAVRMASSNSNGDFTLDGISSGSYTLTADKEGYGAEVRDVTVSESGLNDLELKLAPNSGVTLKVVDGRDGRPLTANVVVYDGQGRVVHDEPFRFGGSSEDLKLTLAPGQYRAVVSAMGYSVRSVSITSPSNQTVSLTPGGTLIIRSSSSAAQRARLIDSSGQAYTRPNSRNAVFLLDGAPGTMTLQNVAPGSYTLQLLDSNDAAIKSTTVIVVEGQTATVSI
ncbi:MAG TPA: carboxypeptidase regulatory-like domain-containing protein [Thermoanaerobaculia bacterium]|jgi:protocatechuate 3,4-dioxygenase beta subunit|nr:carboxypeptidase regulatory-like domain-containing protein [Thermoanaerobaculia bacterium]